MVCPACNARYEGGQFCAKDGTPLVRDPAAGKQNLVGTVLADRYRIARLIGEGGMGQVYEAQHVNINKRFAIKLLRPEIVSNPEAVARFRQEAWSASSIGHENIIEIDDFATLPSGSVYLAMEYLAGRSLAERMRDGAPVDVGEGLELFSQVARGLSAAHDKGIIHRDMKPENIFIAERHGRAMVKILDFGIAKVSGAEGASSLTRTGAIFGTPHYMSPEQAMGNSLDHRSDIYSVGVIMYEVFTGRVPFEAESFMGILTKHITVVPKRPTEMAPDRNIPEEIEEMILRAMAKEPAERYQSMHDLFADLQSLLQLFAPHLLVQASAHPSTPMPVVARTTPPLGTRRPSESMPRATSQRPNATASAMPVEAAPPPRKRSMLPLVAGLALLLAAGGGAFVVFHKKEPVVVPTPKPADPPKPVVTPLGTPKPAAEKIIVIVDSVPPGANILHAGKVIGDTPEDIQLEAGSSMSVVLQRSGYSEETITIDPAKSRKVMVKLHKIEKPSPPPVKLPAPPPLSKDPPPRPQPPAHPPVYGQPPPYTQPPVAHPPPKHRPVDPYERIDDAPRGKKSGGDVLNPY